MGFIMKITTNIHDLKLTKLSQIKDDRGAVFHYLKSTDETFKQFGEAYFSKINPKIIKGWKLHKSIFQHFCVPFGAIKIVIFDNRVGSPSVGKIAEILLDDESNYFLLSMPPGLWYSFKCISVHSSLLANIIDQPHNIGEAVNLPLINTTIDYEWES